MITFLTDLFLSFGAYAAALAVSETIRRNLPNYFRIVVPALLIGTAAAVSGDNIVTWGWFVGITLISSTVLWFMRKFNV